MNVKGKTILVTGAGSGIGKALTLELLSLGARVFALDANEAALKDLKKEVNSKDLETRLLDITDKESVSRVAGEFKTLDGIINNAGIIQPFLRVNDLSDEAIEKVMNVNFYGTLNMVKAFLPNLLKRPEAYIVNVSSMGGFLPVPGEGVYGASKAGVKLLTEALYAELKDTKVHVSVVFPGATNTNITKNSGVSAPDADSGKSYKMTSPEEAAKIIIRGIEREKPRIFIGSDSRMMDFLYRIAPTFATNLIAKQMRSLLSDNNQSEKERG